MSCGQLGIGVLPGDEHDAQHHDDDRAEVVAHQRDVEGVRLHGFVLAAVTGDGKPKANQRAEADRQHHRQGDVSPGGAQHPRLDPFGLEGGARCDSPAYSTASFGQLHEGLLQRGALRRQLVQRDAVAAAGSPTASVSTPSTRERSVGIPLARHAGFRGAPPSWSS